MYEKWRSTYFDSILPIPIIAPQLCLWHVQLNALNVENHN